MITLSLLLIIAIIGIIVLVVMGAAGIFVFGDLIVAILVIAFIIKKIIRK